MTKRRQKQLKRKYEPSDISSNDDAEEIRKYFIDRMIQTIELKVIINACNVGNRILKDFEYDKILSEVNELKNAVLYDNEGGEIIVISPDKVNAIDDLDSKIAKLEDNEWSE